MARILPKYMEAVVSLGAPTPDGGIEWLASGFFVGRKVYPPERQTVFLITNKHVVRGMDQICVRFNNKSQKAVLDVKIPLIDPYTGKKFYTEHPDKDTDVVALGFSPQRCDDFYLKLSYFDLDEDALSLKGMEKKDLSEGEFVYTLGFPLGKVSDIIKAPFCRLGCISRIAEAFRQPNPTGTFLIDAQVFPGNSGGPIVSRADSIPYTSDFQGSLQHKEKSYLIGIVSQYLSFLDERIALSDGPQMSLITGDEVTLRAENSGLAVIHPVDRIREVVDLEWRRVFQGIVPPVPPYFEPHFPSRNTSFDRGEMPPVTPPKESP